MAKKTYFGRELFEFLLELRLNNDRGWFEANRERYELHVREPLMEFVADFAEPLNDISPRFVADPRPSGGSIFRVHRDVRFSKDKSPYKTMAAAQFRHESAKDVHSPGFYLHLEPGNVFAGTGIWHPDSETLAKVRNAIVANPRRWRKALSSVQFSTTHKFEGESLVRPPKGYDPDHPHIEDLKRKDFVTVVPYQEEDACAPGFIDRFAESCRAAAPLMEFLTRAVGLPW